MIIESKIALGLIFAMAMQAVTAFIWAGGAAERLKRVEAELKDQRIVAERLARVETEVIAARRQLDRIEGKIAP